jgi:hypothetical protein
MREKVEEFVANKKASIELNDNTTVKVAESANDEGMDFDNVFTFRKKELTSLRPSDKAELDNEIVQVLTACDLLSEKNKKYHEDYVVRGTQALYGLLADIYAMGIKINLSYSKDNILEAMRRKLRDRGLRTNFNTPLMTTVIKYVVGAERQTAANYSRVLTIAMNENLAASELAEYISRRGGISQIHNAELAENNKKLCINDAEDRQSLMREFFYWSKFNSKVAINYDTKKILTHQLNSSSKSASFYVFLAYKEMPVTGSKQGKFSILSGHDVGDKFENLLLNLITKDMNLDLNRLREAVNKYQTSLIEKKKIPEHLIKDLTQKIEDRQKLIDKHKQEIDETNKKDLTLKGKDHEQSPSS